MLRRIAAMMSVVLIFITAMTSVSAVDIITITKQPESETGYVGDELSFSVTATDKTDKKLGYQWYFGSKRSDGSILSDTELSDSMIGFVGSDTPTLKLTLTADMLAADRVFYVYCIISDSDGNVARTDDAQVVALESGDYEIPVNYRPGGVIETNVGDEVMITAGTTMSEAQIGILNYQWYAFNDTPESAVALDGENKPYLTIVPDRAGVRYYFCVITNDKNGRLTKSGIPTEKSQAVAVKAAESSPLPFTDVSAGDTYYVDLRLAYERGIINGKSSELFCPDDSLTSAEAVKLASCLYALTVGGEGVFRQSEVWYQTYYDYAEANGIGVASLTNEPNSPITRAQFAVLLTSLTQKAGVAAGIDNGASSGSEESNSDDDANADDIKDGALSNEETAAIELMQSLGVFINTDTDFNASSDIPRFEAVHSVAVLIELLNI